MQLLLHTDNGLLMLDMAASNRYLYKHTNWLRLMHMCHRKTAMQSHDCNHSSSSTDRRAAYSVLSSILTCACIRRPNDGRHIELDQVAQPAVGPAAKQQQAAGLVVIHPGGVLPGKRMECAAELIVTP